MSRFFKHAFLRAGGPFPIITTQFSEIFQEMGNDISDKTSVPNGIYFY